MSVHRAGGSGLRDEALQPSIQGASCTGRARARRLDGLSFFGPVPPTTNALTEAAQGSSSFTTFSQNVSYRCRASSTSAGRLLMSWPASSSPSSSLRAAAPVGTILGCVQQHSKSASLIGRE